jgi:predicted transcriptional regulator
VSTQRSVTPGYRTCLGCGTRTVLLKPHVNTQHGLTPESYRVRWGFAV